MNLLAKEWAKFREMAIPADASESDVRRARGSFYLGATVTFSLMLWGALDRTVPLAEEEMARIHAELERELREFHHLPPP
jgi:hypothetical protein